MPIMTVNVDRFPEHLLRVQYLVDNFKMQLQVTRKLINRAK